MSDQVTFIQDEHGDREVRRGDKVLGWVEQGRDMTDLKSNWTEWQFTPADPEARAFPVRRTYLAAHHDALAHAASVK